MQGLLGYILGLMNLKTARESVALNQCKSNVRIQLLRDHHYTCEHRKQELQCQRSLEMSELLKSLRLL